MLQKNIAQRLCEKYFTHRLNLRTVSRLINLKKIACAKNKNKPDYNYYFIRYFNNKKNNVTADVKHSNIKLRKKINNATNNYLQNAIVIQLFN